MHILIWSQALFIYLIFISYIYIYHNANNIKQDAGTDDNVAASPLRFDSACCPPCSYMLVSALGTSRLSLFLLHASCIHLTQLLSTICPQLFLSVNAKIPRPVSPLWLVFDLKRKKKEILSSLRIYKKVFLYF